jgi:hypothetical protein
LNTGLPFFFNWFGFELVQVIPDLSLIWLKSMLPTLRLPCFVLNPFSPLKTWYRSQCSHQRSVHLVFKYIPLLQLCDDVRNGCTHLLADPQNKLIMQSNPFTVAPPTEIQDNLFAAFSTNLKLVVNFVCVFQHL